VREIFFTRAAISALLAEVAADYDERGGLPLTVLIYGGAAITLRHDFRAGAHDIDYAILEESPLFAECVDAVGQRHGFFPRWMHTQDFFKALPHFLENFHRHADKLPCKSSAVTFLVQDDDWQIANRLCWFRRYRQTDGKDLLELLRVRKESISQCVPEIVQDIFGGESGCSPDGMMILSAIENGADFSELAERLAERASYYEKIYQVLIPLLKRKDTAAADDIFFWESRNWQSEEDFRTSLCRHKFDLPPIIANHIARVMFQPEYWSF
jgi:hypothetical protein